MPYRPTLICHTINLNKILTVQFQFSATTYNQSFVFSDFFWVLSVTCVLATASTAKAPNSTANGTKSTAKVTNSIAKTCNFGKFSNASLPH